MKHDIYPQSNRYVVIIMNEYELGCSVSPHFKGGVQEIDDAVYEEQEKQRLLTFSKDERSLWCWICGFMIDPCDYPTPKEGVMAFALHLTKCEFEWRSLQTGDGL